MKFSRPLLALAGIVVVGLVVVGVRLVIWSGQASDSARSGPAIGGPFTLVDQTGKTVTEKDYMGRHVLIFFGYTFCPDVCPTTLNTVSAALDKLGPQAASRVVPLFVTVDPERDTPKVMKEYVTAFNPAIQGLTGSPEQVAQAAKAFKVYAAKVKSDSSDSYTMDHSAILYLMGRDGRFVAHFVHGISVDDLVSGLRKHLG